MRDIPIGESHIEIFYPQKQHLASALGNHGVDVVATTALILFFEATSNNLVAPYYERQEVSVGTHVKVDHVAPAMSSMPISVSAVLANRQGRKLEFQLEAKQNDKLIMSGEHHRAVISDMRFSQSDSEAETKKVDFWFDFHSPWCYFASHRIGDIARELKLSINWKPVHLANLSLAVDGRRPLEANKNFVSWYQKDQIHTAQQIGLPFKQHNQYPLRPSRALRAAIYANEQGLAEPFVQQVMRGYWSEQKDISDIEWLREVALNCTLDDKTMASAVIAEEYKNKLNENLNQAINQKLFGLPSTVVDGEIYWGNDRLDLFKQHMLMTAQYNGL